MLPPGNRDIPAEPQRNRCVNAADKALLKYGRVPMAAFEYAGDLSFTIRVLEILCARAVLGAAC